MRKTVLITAGGTGGHIFPALAVAKCLIPEYNLSWVGAKGGIENKIVKENNIDIVAINISGLRKNGLKRLVLMPFMLLRAFYQAFIIIFKSRADVIIGFGGYATFPVCVVGRLLQIPVIIHEQNSVPGLTNKILAKIVNKVLVAFPDVLLSKRTVLVGNPVRDDILNIASPETRYLQHNGGISILVLGGSLGASIFNKILPEVFAEVLKTNPGYIARITHQIGRGDGLAVEALYADLGLSNIVKVVNFIDNMADAYSKTDLIICRSGASTVSEICAVGIAAIFIPYPHAVDNHQLYNATPLVDAAAAKIILQKELTVSKLADMICSLGRKDCQMMAENAKKMAIRDSASKIKNIVTSYIS